MSINVHQPDPTDSCHYCASWILGAGASNAVLAWPEPWLDCPDLTESEVSKQASADKGQPGGQE